MRCSWLTCWSVSCGRWQSSLTGRLPGLAEGGLHSANYGVDGITPDQQPIIGPAAPIGPEGLWLDCGFSGTGFKTAPAVGESLAQMILDGVAAAPELAVFGADRLDGLRQIAPPHPIPRCGTEGRGPARSREKGPFGPCRSLPPP